MSSISSPSSKRLGDLLSKAWVAPRLRHITGLYLIASVCGLIDAACFLSFGGVFAEMMTGNLLLLSLDIGMGSALAKHLIYVMALLAFILGAVAGGRILKSRLGDSRFGFFVEWCMLALALALTLVFAPGPSGAARDVVVVLLALAMGIQNALLRRHGVPDLATNVMTLTMAALVSESSLAGGTNERWQRRAGSVGIFAVSAMVGAALNTYVGPWAALAAAVLVFSAALLALTRSATTPA